MSGSGHAALCRDATGDFAALPAALWLAAEHGLFPARLRPIPESPEGIWLRAVAPQNAAELWSMPAVALVGARRASGAGLAIARTLAWGLARAGVLVVSGLARGIDAAAHEGALLGDGRTVAILASGLDRCYPPEHERLAAQIARRGALLSEWEGGAAPLAWRFPRRNRLISGLSDIVILVEGELRSGARHTVDSALAQGREVMAVPRDPVFPGAEGPNRLLRDGAAPALEVADVIAHLRALGRGPRDAGAAGGGGAAPREASRSPVRARILAWLGREGSMTAGAIAARLPEIPPAAIVSGLTALEVEGRVRRDRAGGFRLAGGG